MEAVAEVMRQSWMDKEAQSPPGRLELQLPPASQAHGYTVLAYLISVSKFSEEQTLIGLDSDVANSWV